MKKFAFILILAVFFSALGFIFLKGRYWNGEDKLIYVSGGKNYDVNIVILDPHLGEITTINIPGSTEVNVSRNYGQMQLKNVYQLGINEKIGSRLLVETIMKNFSFPVILYWDSKDTNIPFSDRIRATFFIKKVSDINKSNIDLQKSQYVKKAVLADGSDGFKISDFLSPRLTSLFSDNTITPLNLRIKISDYTGGTSSSNEIASILEVLGGKVVSIEKGSKKDFNCLVEGKNIIAVEKVIDLFDCKKNIQKSDGFDLEISLGDKFSSKF